MRPVAAGAAGENRDGEVGGGEDQSDGPAGPEEVGGRQEGEGQGGGDDDEGGILECRATVGGVIPGHPCAHGGEDERGRDECDLFAAAVERGLREVAGQQEPG